MPFRLPEGLFSVAIRSRRELTAYMARTTVLCVTAALAVDVVNQLTFFAGWAAALRSWGITVLLVMAIAIPVTRAIGRAHLALWRASQTDPLTGLLNRRALLEGVEGHSILMALIIVDVDRFKAVNDTYGHMVGDDVLRTVAHLLDEHFSGLCRVGRLGGEEFALLSAAHDGRSLLPRLDSFRTRIAATPIVAGAAAVTVTISAGVAHRHAGQSFEDLYAEADRALYRAKAGGRNRIVVAEEGKDAGVGMREAS